MTNRCCLNFGQPTFPKLPSYIAEKVPTGTNFGHLHFPQLSSYIAEKVPTGTNFGQPTFPKLPSYLHGESVCDAGESTCDACNINTILQGENTAKSLSRLYYLQNIVKNIVKTA